MRKIAVFSTDELLNVLKYAGIEAEDILTSDELESRAVQGKAAVRIDSDPKQVQSVVLTLLADRRDYDQATGWLYFPMSRLVTLVEKAYPLLGVTGYAEGLGFELR